MRCLGLVTPCFGALGQKPAKGSTLHQTLLATAAVGAVGFVYMTSAGLFGGFLVANRAFTTSARPPGKRCHMISGNLISGQRAIMHFPGHHPTAVCRLNLRISDMRLIFCSLKCYDGPHHLIRSTPQTQLAKLRDKAILKPCSSNHPKQLLLSP